MKLKRLTFILILWLSGSLDLALHTEGFFQCLVIVRRRRLGLVQRFFVVANPLIFYGSLLWVDDFRRNQVELFTAADAHEAPVTRLAIKQLVQIFSKDGRGIRQGGHSSCMRRLERRRSHRRAGL